MNPVAISVRGMVSGGKQVVQWVALVHVAQSGPHALHVGGVEKYPLGQDVHTPVTELHVLQFIPPRVLLQLTHVVAPAELAYVSTPHATQVALVVAPAMADALPATQSMHDAELLTSAYLPAIHRTHEPEEYPNPAGHSTHTPVEATHVAQPVQAVHEAAPSAECVLVGHVAHVAVPPAE